MSLDVVSKKIAVIERKPVIKAEDIDEVILAAERSVKGRTDGVSNAEGRAVADLYLRTKTAAPSTKLPQPKLEDGAVTKLNAFFIAHNLPYGENKQPMKERLLQELAKPSERGGKEVVIAGALTPLGEEITQKPRTGSLQPLRLSAQGQPQVDAYVDVVKKQFIVKHEGAFYGPFGLDV